MERIADNGDDLQNYEEGELVLDRNSIYCTCEDCGQSNASVILRKGECRLCWDCYRKKLKTKRRKLRRCNRCGATENLKKLYKENIWFCDKHFPKNKHHRIREPRSKIKHFCDVCGTIEDVKKYNKRNEWYCTTHWPQRKPAVKHPCDKCGTTEGVRKQRNKDEWYCRKHQYLSHKKAKKSCCKCGAIENIVYIVLKKISICKKCAEKDHICLVCGDEMVQIGRCDKHYICTRARQNGHRNMTKTSG